MTRDNKKTKIKLSQIKLIALGYFMIVLLGTVLLMLPQASVSHHSAPFLTALFTAVSSSCVTGLILVDTATYWSLFGQIVIICLIQLGGLGYITVATLFISLFQKRLGLRNRTFMAQSINTERLVDLKGLAGKILGGTALIEGVGALLLGIRFVPQFGVKKGIYYAVFHSISAFCNAGFDLMGAVKEPFCSLTDYAGDLTVNVTVMALITLGGLGFLVWEDVWNNRWHIKKYTLHTKIVLITSAVCTFGSAVLFYIFESNGVLKNCGTTEKILCALFQSVTCRTAGFNTVDLARLSNPSVILSCILMFIGGSPGSTAGGAKTTTLFVLLAFMFSYLRGDSRVHIFGRKIKEEAFKTAISVVLFNTLIILTASVMIGAIENTGLSDLLFETFSAMGTVGMTTGITRELHPLSAYIIALMMFCGRVGSVSLATALIEKRKIPPVLFPEEAVTVG